MGMFDSFWARCDGCGGSVEFQTKAGHCQLCDYRDGDDLPLAIVGDLDGATEQCPNCKNHVTLRKDFKVTLRSE